MTTDYNRYVYGRIGYNSKLDTWSLRDDVERRDHTIHIGQTVHIGQVMGWPLRAKLTTDGWLLEDARTIGDLLPSKTYGGQGGIYVPVDDDLMIS